MIKRRISYLRGCRIRRREKEGSLRKIN